jgi:Flp pilus assembly protein TadG
VFVVHCQTKHRVENGRRGVSSVELAVLLPLLTFLFVITIDYARVFFQSVTINNCARQGALYGSQDPTHAADTAGIQAAALNDASNLNPAPTVTSTTGTDADGNPCIQVTVSYTFQTLTQFPVVPSSFVVSRTVQMRVSPTVPKGS